jgi:stearoyl-CoA desaturase (delta-9 desaturase)
MMGEGYHNNHHKYANSPNFGVKWYEIDITYLIIKVLNVLKVIQLKPIKVTNE